MSAHLPRHVPPPEAAHQRAEVPPFATPLPHTAALQIVARKRQQKHSASRLRLQLDRVVWQLCTMAREPFVQASRGYQEAVNHLCHVLPL